MTNSNYTTEPIYCNFNANGYRLPTEGEWEYFTRAGKTGPFSCDEPVYTRGTCWTCDRGYLNTLEKYCVFCSCEPARTSPVGSKLSNPWNLKDVHGNVREWCWDWKARYPTGTVIDYIGPCSGAERVYRGGSWKHCPNECRSADRTLEIPSSRKNFRGFRLVRTIWP